MPHPAYDGVPIKYYLGGGRVRTSAGCRCSRPVHSKSFVCVGGGLRPPTHTKQFARGREKSAGAGCPLAPWVRTGPRPVPGHGRGGSETRPYLSAAGGSAPRRSSDAIAPCIERVLRGCGPGFARPAPTQNRSPRERIQQTSISKTPSFPLNDIHLGGGRVRTPAGRPRSRPVHRRSFWCVAGGLRPPATHQKQCVREKSTHERRCVVMLDRPGLNPRAKWGEAPFGGS